MPEIDLELDRMCVCKHRFGMHAIAGDWCPIEEDGRIIGWSKTSKFKEQTDADRDTQQTG